MLIVASLVACAGIVVGIIVAAAGIERDMRKAAGKHGRKGSQ